MIDPSVISNVLVNLHGSRDMHGLIPRGFSRALDSFAYHITFGHEEYDHTVNVPVHLKTFEEARSEKDLAKIVNYVLDNALEQFVDAG